LPAFVQATAAWERADPGLPPRSRGKAEAPPSSSSQAIATGARQAASVHESKTSGSPPLCFSWLHFDVIASDDGAPPPAAELAFRRLTHRHEVADRGKAPESPTETMLSPAETILLQQNRIHRNKTDAELKIHEILSILKIRRHPGSGKMGRFCCKVDTQ
jgi:hypothetical protein